MAKLPLMCRIFGHKFIATIYDGKWDSETYQLRHLNEPICKRCGLTRADIIELTRK